MSLIHSANFIRTSEVELDPVVATDDHVELLRGEQSSGTASGEEQNPGVSVAATNGSGTPVAEDAQQVSVADEGDNIKFVVAVRVVQVSPLWLTTFSHLLVEIVQKVTFSQHQLP